MSAKKDGTAQEYFESLRSKGIDAVLLESGSAEGTKSRNGEISWSFVGVVNKKIRVPDGEAGMTFMRDFVRKNKVKKNHQDPPFIGGFVGFISYDLGEKWQGINTNRKGNNPKLRSVAPLAYFVYVDRVVAFHSNRVTAKIKSRSSSMSFAQNAATSSAGGIQSKTKSEYIKKIKKIKNKILDGETYQVNFSQRFSVTTAKDPFQIYKQVIARNPSPFQFYLETPNFAVISNSPERLCTIRDGFIETRPIKGTVPRGKSSVEDKKNIADLIQSEKQMAELAMIVDLARNDLGKICKPGTVHVNEDRTIEKYSHVIHTVSNVRGKLQKGVDWYDALRALFPGGSVTGCPKKRTMEIIHGLESEPRGVYCGSAGYINLTGECDFNIMIRTLWLDKKKSQITFRAGGGIVADSDPADEYSETVHKVGVFLNVLSK